MKIIMDLNGIKIEKEIPDDLRKPAQIIFNKVEVIDTDPTVTLMGQNSGIYAGSCAIVTSVLKELHPDNKKMQKAVLDLLYASVSGDLGLNTADKPRSYGPISPDDVDF